GREDDAGKDSRPARPEGARGTARSPAKNQTASGRSHEKRGRESGQGGREANRNSVFAESAHRQSRQPVEKGRFLEIDHVVCPWNDRARPFGHLARHLRVEAFVGARDRNRAEADEKRDQRRGGDEEEGGPDPTNRSIGPPVHRFIYPSSREVQPM